MSNPLRRLKFLPWLSLFQVAALSVFLVFVIEVLLLEGARFPLINRLLSTLFQSSLGLFVLLGVAMGLGALAAYILERSYRQIAINAAILWALILCLMVVLLVKSVLPLPALFLSANYTSLMGILLGVFWQGRA